jgi:hypothetical protein
MALVQDTIETELFVFARFNSSVTHEKKELSACRGEGSAVGPLLAARALRCAALLVLRVDML